MGSVVPDPLWEWRTLSASAREVDVLFCPSYTIPLGYSQKCVVTYLGPSVNRLGTKEWFRNEAYDRLHRYSARNADHVLTCSEAVKRRVVKTYGVAPARVSVTLLAPGSVFSPVTDAAKLAEARRKYLRSDHPYILFVGKLSGRHYLPNLLEAFVRLRKDGKVPHKLLIAGPDPLNLNIPKRARALGVAGDVVYVPFVEHRCLPPLYSGADIFVFPASEAEGFGLPVIEAMACGTAVLSTNQGSIPEFADGASLLVESSSSRDLFQGLVRLVSDEALKKQLGQKALERAGELTWKKVADTTLSVLWQIACENTQ